MEALTPYRNGNGMPNMHTELMATSGIELHYRTGAEVLLAAILREPHVFQTVANRISPAWWKQTKYEHIARLVFEQFYGSAKSYSAYSVCRPGSDVSESELYEAMQRHSDTELLPALEMFEPLYRQWVELKASQFAAHGIAQGWDAEQIRAKQDEFRRDSCAYMTREGDGNEALQKWFMAKIEGLEINYPCKPSLQSMINQRFKIAYEPGDFIIAAGRPSMGKTHWLLNELDHFARCGVRGIFISIDMERLKIQKRLIGQKTGISPKADWSKLQDYQYQALQQAYEQVEKWPIVMVDDVINVHDIVSLCHAEHYKQPIHFLAIDYLQLLTIGATSGKGEANRNNELSTICRQLKHLSKSLRIPVIALSQLSRAVDSRGGSKRPQLSDLRDSGSIEQDASTVIFFYRPEYYGIMEMEDGRSTKGVGELIFAKQQEDSTGTLNCAFDEVRGWKDLDDYRFPTFESGTTIPPLDYSIPASARPDLDNDKDIPF